MRLEEPLAILMLELFSICRAVGFVDLLADSLRGCPRMCVSDSIMLLL